MKRYYKKNKKVPSSAIAKSGTFIRAKKSLGQNFLKSETALRKIIEVGEIKQDDVILEIGPGRGALTEKLLEKAGTVIAVEKDYELFEFLKIKFAEQITSGILVLVHDDILKFDITRVWQNVFERTLGSCDGNEQRKFSAENFCGESENILPNPKTYKIIANIPYNITGAILKKFLEETHQPEMMVLMVQHEVAQRIIGNSPSSAKAMAGKKESILSISVKAYGEPKMIAKVEKRYFSPAPKVDSAIISIKNISRKNFNSPLEEYPLGGGGNASTPSRERATPQEGNKVDEQKFWEIVKTGFAHKRKKLSSNLKTLSKNGSLASVLEGLGNKRAEDLSLADWIVLAREETNPPLE
ncbi:MAG: rRNA adenine dimethyltransferase family protein [Candidatus Nomurabacteria bacterium]|nr:rRNA adenine dimethyltransferase family protein [Candidatus Nomurabacteria bacterium]